MNIKEILQLEIKQINKAPLTNIVENAMFWVGFSCESIKLIEIQSYEQILFSSS